MKKFIGMTLTMGLGLLGSGMVLAAEPVGVIQQVSGAVLLQHGMQTYQVHERGATLQSGDSVITTDTGTTLWRMADDSLFAMGPNSGVRIADYVQPDAQDSAGRANYVLIQGAFRTITGKIGTVQANAGMMRGHLMNAALLLPRNPAYFRKVDAPATKASAYQIKTAMASISTQSADYIAAIVPGQLALKINSGIVDVCNSAGCASPSRGQYAVVKCPTCKPQIVANDINMPLAVAKLSVQDMSVNANVTITNPIAQPPLPIGCAPVVNPTGACAPGGPGKPVSPN